MDISFQLNINGQLLRVVISPIRHFVVLYFKHNFLTAVQTVFWYQLEKLLRRVRCTNIMRGTAPNYCIRN